MLMGVTQGGMHRYRYQYETSPAVAAPPRVGSGHKSIIWGPGALESDRACSRLGEEEGV